MGHRATRRTCHKLLTGRQDGFDRSRHRRPVRLPSRAESEHDVIENSHASTVLRLGRRPRQGQRAARRRDDHVVAVIGDGALTGGMAWRR